MEKMQFIEQQHIFDRVPAVSIVTNDVDVALSAQEKIERKGGIRLTAAMRDSIVEKVWEFKFKKSGEKLDAQEVRLAHKAMVAVFGKAALEALEKIGPPYAFTAHDKDGTKLVGEALEKWKGTKITWRLGNGYQIGMYVRDPLPPFVTHYGHNNNKYFVVKPGALTDEITAWYEACQDWLKQKRETQLKVNAVLNSVTTFNSLQKTWPAGERFWKHIPVDFPFRNQVPAIKVDELNEALGL